MRRADDAGYYCSDMGEKFPSDVLKLSNGIVILSTFGSLRAALRLGLNSRELETSKRPQYDVIIVDEASKLDDESCASVLHILSRNGSSGLNTVSFLSVMSCR